MKAHTCLLTILLTLVLASISVGEIQPTDMTTQQFEVPQQQQMPERVVTLDLKDTPIKDAFDALFAGSGRVYVLDPGAVGNVSVRLEGVPFSSALRMLTNAAGLDLREQCLVFITRSESESTESLVEMAKSIPPPPAASLARSVPGMTQQQAAPSGRIQVSPSPGQRTTRSEARFDVSFEQAVLIEAVKQLLDTAGMDYVLDLGASPQVTMAYGPRVTARMKQATLDSVLDVLTKTAGLVVEKTGGAYMIRMGPGYPSQSRGQVSGSCSRCGQALFSDWGYCPACGLRNTITPAGKVGPPVRTK